MLEFQAQKGPPVTQPFPGYFFSSRRREILLCPPTLKDCGTVPIGKPAPKLSPDPGSPVQRSFACGRGGKGGQQATRAIPTPRKGKDAVLHHFAAPVLATENQAAAQTMHTAGEHADRLCPAALGWFCRALGLEGGGLTAYASKQSARGAHGTLGMRKELGSLGEALCRAGLELVLAGVGM